MLPARMERTSKVLSAGDTGSNGAFWVITRGRTQPGKSKRQSSWWKASHCRLDHAARRDGPRGLALYLLLLRSDRDISRPSRGHPAQSPAATSRQPSERCSSPAGRLLWHSQHHLFGQWRRTQVQFHCKKERLSFGQFFFSLKGLKQKSLNVRQCSPPPPHPDWWNLACSIRSPDWLLQLVCVLTLHITTAKPHPKPHSWYIPNHTFSGALKFHPHIYLWNKPWKSSLNSAPCENLKSGSVSQHQRLQKALFTDFVKLNLLANYIRTSAVGKKCFRWHFSVCDSLSLSNFHPMPGPTLETGLIGINISASATLIRLGSWKGSRTTNA